MSSNQSLRVGQQLAATKLQSASQVTNDKDGGEAAREFRRLMNKKISRADADRQANQNFQAYDSKESSLQGSVASCELRGHSLEHPGEISSEETLGGCSAQFGTVEATADKALDPGYAFAAPQSALAEQVSDNRTRDADEFEALIGPQLGKDLAPQGSFELLMPNQEKIGVEYALSHESIQVLLKASSRELCMRLRACAEGIGSRMTKRCGRQVDVFAL